MHLDRVRGKPATSSRQPVLDPAERRCEERYEADGEVKLSLAEPVTFEISGRLMDYSRSGFRAIHQCSELHTGQIVEFQHTVAQGRARVIWNRILPERVESGFLVVPDAGPSPA